MVTRETRLQDGLRRLGLWPPKSGVDPVGKLLAYHDLLASEAIPRGFLGPREAGRLVERHILESAALLPHLGLSPASRTSTLIDVGSGAGLPGVVLAAVSEIRVVLLDAEARRAEFLRGLGARLELGVEVVQARAEDAGRDQRLRERFDTAVARALAPPRVSLELTLPFVRIGGLSVLGVGPSARAELSRAAEVASALAGAPPRLVDLEVPGLRARRWAMIVRKVGRCPERFPRRAGVPERRPLGRAQGPD